MPESPLRLVKRCAEFRLKEHVNDLPEKLRGIYVLYRQCLVAGRLTYDVQYVGMAKVGIKGRLLAHTKSKRMRNQWTHFSAFEVWDNIRDEEIAELEGLFRHIYRKDSAASALNIQRGFTRVVRTRQNDLNKWQPVRKPRKVARVPAR
jgi:hypothetical protein